MQPNAVSGRHALTNVAGQVKPNQSIQLAAATDVRSYGCLVAYRERLLLSAQPLFDNVLPLFPELARVLDSKPVLKNLPDLLESEAGDLWVKEV